MANAPRTSGPSSGPSSPTPRVQVVLPAALTAPEPAEELRCEATTVRELLDAVAVARADVAGRLFFGGRPLVTVVLNGTVLAPQTAMAHALTDGDRAELLPPVAGG